MKSALDRLNLGSIGYHEVLSHIWYTQQLEYKASKTHYLATRKERLKTFIRYQFMVNYLYGKTIMLWVNDLDFMVNINGKLEYSQGILVSQHHPLFLTKRLEGYFPTTLSSHMQRINANISSTIAWGRGGSISILFFKDGFIQGCSSI